MSSARKNRRVQSSFAAPAVPQETDASQTKSQWNRVTVNISAARFESQIICSNRNKSHLVIFPAGFIVLGFFVVCSSERKEGQAQRPGYCHSIAEPFWKSPLSVCFSLPPLSVFPYGCMRWKASSYNFQVAQRQQPPPPLPTHIHTPSQKKKIRMSKANSNDWKCQWEKVQYIH